jgi:hypothetical protein
VWASSSDGTHTIVLAKRSGTRGNLITTTETCAHVAWGAATLASGAGSEGQINLVAGFPVMFVVPSFISTFPGNTALANPSNQNVTSLAAIAGGAGTLAIIRV